VRKKTLFGRAQPGYHLLVLSLGIDPKGEKKMKSQVVSTGNTEKLAFQHVLTGMLAGAFLVAILSYFVPGWIAAIIVVALAVVLSLLYREQPQESR
jgi:1,4-dihydroxy-2-naphthoate octaprenyltransferase